MSLNCLSTTALHDFFSKDVNRIQGRVVPSLAANSPYLGVNETGTFPAGISDQQRAVVTQMIPPAVSLTNPNWSARACRKEPCPHEAGSDEYAYSLQENFDRSDWLCLAAGYSAVRGNLVQFEKSYENLITLYWNAWLRWQNYSLSANKIVAFDNGKVSFNDLLTTGVGCKFAAGIIPNSPLTFQFVQLCMTFMIHARFCGPAYRYGSGVDQHLRMITDQQTIFGFRNDPAVREDLRAAVKGRFVDRYDQLFGYSWMGPYQGLGFGVDETILRADSINPVTGDPNFIQPFLPNTNPASAATVGVKAVINPAWLSAPYQVSFLYGKGAFMRLIPEEYLGEGTAKFDKQFYTGQLQWHNQRDNECNVRGDSGFWYWTQAAAMRPERPEFCMAILHARCQEDLGLNPCSNLEYYQNTAGEVVC